MSEPFRNVGYMFIQFKLNWLFAITILFLVGDASVWNIQFIVQGLLHPTSVLA